MKPPDQEEARAMRSPVPSGEQVGSSSWLVIEKLLVQLAMWLLHTV